jgi:hypothetical protein
MTEVSRGCDLSVASGEILLLQEVVAGARPVGASVKLLGFLEELDPVARTAVLALEGATVKLSTELLASVPLVEGQLYHVIGELEESESSERVTSHRALREVLTKAEEKPQLHSMLTTRCLIF